MKDDGTYEVFGIGECTDTDIVIPATYNDKPVTSIGIFSFADKSSLTSVTILDGVTSIGMCAFDCATGITKVIIPDSVTTTGNLAFNNCGALTNITFEGTVAQWNAITKDGNLIDGSTPATYVQCSDGQVPLQ